ncbi:hypothetical protein F383_13308 [Gossypium arboreum]|nr:hypothetical protein F383_32955 [Gossypium arboreum]KHG07711.1 hypothetical protein F383_33915 [Gossypium arboreum]KHG28416.1 hypothetical protein F383_34984 [Gossypium arboreum]KHG30326.1 hypothetical protein F383_13308 [Gossypium arboreum]
MCALWI